MPLVVMCGKPATGKTSFAKLIANKLSEENHEVVLINEESENINKTEGYKDGRVEKMTRGTLKSAVERTLTSNRVVIIDSMNYIKGFRYELFCRSREYNTNQIWIQASEEDAKKWNETRENKFTEKQLEELNFRFEIPNSRNRWDNPLIRIENKSDMNLIDEIPFDEIKTSLFEKEKLKPNLATAVAAVADSDTVNDIDRITNDICQYILNNQSVGGVGRSLPIEGSSKQLKMSRAFGAAELRRLRRQFLTICRHSTPMKEKIHIYDSFITYLQSQIDL